MAKISSYPIISTPSPNDLLIGTDAVNQNQTKNFKVSSIATAISGLFVPYTGATGNVNLGVNNISAAGFLVPGGLSSQFLKANGTLDSTIYTPQSRTITINGVTYDLSANRSWVVAGGITLTTTGIGGASTYASNNLNVPVYQSQGDYIDEISGEATGVGPGNAFITLSNAAIINKILTGLSISGGTISSTDSILQAFGKIQNQLNSVLGGVEYQGTWNAFINVPNLQSSVGTKGFYYVVDVAGSTPLNGISNWAVGDWAIFNGSSWEKVDNTDAVVSVFGRVGAITAQSGDYSTTIVTEGTNLYFTNTRSRTAISSSATGLTYTSGTGIFSLTSGYSIPTTASQASWNSAYNDSIISAVVTGTTTKTLTLTQQDGGTIVASWSDINTDAVTSVFGRLGNVVAQSGDYTTTLVTEGTNLYFTNTRARSAISLTTIGSSGASTYNSTTGILNIPDYSGGAVTSVGLTMPAAFSVSNSPITGSGTIAVEATGTAAQYIRGDGTLADTPTNVGGGGTSVSYYLNGSVNQGVFGGSTYYEIDRIAILGGGTDFSRGTDGLISQFITDAGAPESTLIPGGNWNFELYFSASSGGGTPSFYVELYKYDGTTFTLISSSIGVPELIAFGTIISPYFFSLAVPETALTVTDRLAVRIYVNASGRTITLHTEGVHLCQIVTTFTTGVTALNGLTKQVQYFSVGSSGTNFNISSVDNTHTFNLPTASIANRGLLSSSDWGNFNSAYNNSIVSAAVTGTTTQTLTLTQQDGGTITASWAGGGSVSGTTNSVAKFTASDAVGDSQIFDDGTNVGISTIAPVAKLDVNGSIYATGLTLVPFPQPNLPNLQLNSGIAYSTGSTPLTYGGSTQYQPIGVGGNMQLKNTGTATSVGPTGIYSGVAGGGTLTNSPITIFGQWVNAKRAFSDDISTSSSNEVSAIRATAYHDNTLPVTAYTGSMHGTINSLEVNSGIVNFAIATRSFLGASRTSTSLATTINNYYGFYASGTIGQVSGGGTTIGFYAGLGIAAPTINAGSTVTKLRAISSTGVNMHSYHAGNWLLGADTDRGYKLDVTGNSYFQGTVQSTSLAGTGTRLVTADTNGVLGVSGLVSSVVSGSGTTNSVAKFTSSSTLGDSNIYSIGGNIVSMFNGSAFTPSITDSLQIVGHIVLDNFSGTTKLIVNGNINEGDYFNFQLNGDMYLKNGGFGFSTIYNEGYTLGLTFGGNTMHGVTQMSFNDENPYFVIRSNDNTRSIAIADLSGIVASFSNFNAYIYSGTEGPTHKLIVNSGTDYGNYPLQVTGEVYLIGYGGGASQIVVPSQLYINFTDESLVMLASPFGGMMSLQATNGFIIGDCCPSIGDPSYLNVTVGGAYVYQNSAYGSQHASAILQADSIYKGFLPPRMNRTQRLSIPSPAIGLMVYQIDFIPGIYVYASTGWYTSAIASNICLALTNNTDYPDPPPVPTSYITMGFDSYNVTGRINYKSNITTVNAPFVPLYTIKYNAISLGWVLAEYDSEEEEYVTIAFTASDDYNVVDTAQDWPNGWGGYDSDWKVLLSPDICVP